MEAQLRCVLMIALIFFLIHCGSAQPLSSSIERSALLDLRSSLGLRGKDWPIKADPCSSWIGVKCEAGRVIEISVSGLRRTRAGKLNPQFAVDSLVNLTSLASFNASGFSLPGSIPIWFGQSLVALQVLDLRSCSIIGPIPSSMGNMSKLTALYLSGNTLTGIIPSSLGTLSELSVLDLSRNLLTGTITVNLSSLRNLTRLELASNFLSGTIPPGLGALPRLQFLNLSDNSFTDSVPVQLGDLSQLQEFDLGMNALSGSLPGNLFSGLARLRVLVLRANKFSGRLPQELWAMPSLRFLDASSNNLTGELPSLGSNNNASGAVFNLSNNILYGYLNSSLGLFSSIDLSSNYFQGKLPDHSQVNATFSGNCLQMVPDQRSSDDCRKFYSERGLTFDNFGIPGSPDLPSAGPNSGGNNLKFILAGLVGGLGFIIIVVLVMVVVLRFCNKGAANHRGNANVGPVPEGDSPSLPKDPIHLAGIGDSFTYEQMLQATNNFSEANLIKHGHSGDLFRGSLETGFPIVIKRVDLLSLKKAPYVLELEFFSRVAHTRLVPLLGHCLDHENEKLLVYKHMPNGDLFDCLRRATDSEDDSLQSLDWITRLKIATGAAEALSYLHHECDPPIVHGDVQASSILLDDKFEVRLGSLSEVCAQGGDNNHNMLTRLLRRPQASEQGPSGSSTTATCAHDVYCFGKVLLELVTGKIGLGCSDDATTREWLEHTLPYISTFDKELVTKIVDPSLIVDEDLLEEVWAMAVVAKSCLHPRPSKRPLMRYVLKALENPLKVVRVESSSSARLRTNSSRRSWSAAFFGSWRQSSSETASVAAHTSRENASGSRQPGRLGSHGSNGNDYSSSLKRPSNEIFPEPLEIQDIERQE